jgi:predicted nucleic acid-binding protein
MHYYDTNVLVYSLVNLDDLKMQVSQEKLKESSKVGLLSISQLTLQELIFTLAKLNVKEDIIIGGFEIFKEFSKNAIDNEIIIKAFQICKEMNYYRNINDVIHLKYAEKYCSKIITFDQHFKKFIDKTPIEIEILT